ncbi:unnamed protein product, partial [Callosobruchus maculatus]
EKLSSIYPSKAPKYGFEITFYSFSSYLLVPKRDSQIFWQISSFAFGRLISWQLLALQNRAELHPALLVYSPSCQNITSSVRCHNVNATNTGLTRWHLYH